MRRSSDGLSPHLSRLLVVVLPFFSHSAAPYLQRRVIPHTRALPIAVTPSSIHFEHFHQPYSGYTPQSAHDGGVSSRWEGDQNRRLKETARWRRRLPRIGLARI